MGHSVGRNAQTVITLMFNLRTEAQVLQGLKVLHPVQTLADLNRNMSVARLYHLQVIRKSSLHCTVWRCARTPLKPFPPKPILAFNEKISQHYMHRKNVLKNNQFSSILLKTIQQIITIIFCLDLLIFIRRMTSLPYRVWTGQGSRNKLSFNGRFIEKGGGGG